MLTKHDKTFHSGSENGCGKCNQEFENEVQLKEHLKIHNISLKIKWKFKCDICERIFRGPNELKKHFLHFHERKLSCDVCGKRFTNEKSLICHVNSIHKQIKYDKNVTCVTNLLLQSKVIYIILRHFIQKIFQKIVSMNVIFAVSLSNLIQNYKDIYLVHMRS